MDKRYLLKILLVAIFLFLLANKTQAANCGGATVCHCGDTVTSNYTLTSDLNCSSSGTNGLNVGADNITINGNGHTLTGDGLDNMHTGIYILDQYSNVTVQNFANISNFATGIIGDSSIGAVIKNNIINCNGGNGIGFFDSGDGSYSNTATNNTINSTYKGIYFNVSPSGTVTGNTINSAYYGIYLGDSPLVSSLAGAGNTISRSFNTLYDDQTGDTFSNTQLLHNVNNTMLTFTEPAARTINPNGTVTVDFYMNDIHGTSCPTCSYAGTVTSPSETLTITQVSGNHYQASFTVSKVGTYSLDFVITDANNNVTKRNYLFFVNPANSTTATYYLRGVNPTHGQPSVISGMLHDSKALLTTAPTSTEIWYCGAWVQNAPDMIPNYSLAYLSGINIFSWYTAVSGGSIGVQRYGAYNGSIDSSAPVASSSNYTWNNTDLTNFNWAMDYPYSWYWLALKLNANVAGSYVYWTTFPSGYTSSAASYANFTYSYTTTPAVKSISNININVLSATATTDDSKNATLVLNNPTSVTDSTSIVLDSYDRPFSGYTTTIGSDGTATVASGSIAAGATATLNSVKLDIVPNTGSIAVSNITWNTSGTYSKAWTESGSGGVSSATHTVGNLQSNKNYVVRVDGSVAITSITGANGTTCSNGVCTSNSSGQISFNYTGGYSNHTFNIDPPSAPTVTLSAASNVTTTSATINGNVTNDGGDTNNVTVTTYWGTSDGGQTPANWANSSSPTSPSQPQGVAAFYTNLTGLLPNTTYYFSAQATNSAGTSWPAASLNFTTLANTPGTPTVTANAISSSLNVILNTNSNPASTQFAVYNATAGKYVQADGTLGSSPAWQTYAGWGGASGVNNTSLSPNTQYSYEVEAENSANVQTSLSSGVSAYTLALTPTNLTTSTITANTVTLTVDPLANATSGSSGYCFYRSGTSCTSTSWTQTNTYQDTGLTCGTSYIYYVKYRNGDGTATSPVSTTATTSSCGGGGGSSSLLLLTPLATSLPQTSQTPTTSTTPPTTPTTPSSLQNLQAELQQLMSEANSLKPQGQQPQTVSKTPSSVQTPSSGGSFTLPLGYGSNNSQVILLQNTLKNLGFFPATTTPNGHFGPATLKAVEAFQLQHGIAKPGNAAYGYVGPKTRALLNSMAK